MIRLLLFLVSLLACACSSLVKVPLEEQAPAVPAPWPAIPRLCVDHVFAVAPLLDPAKLDTLKSERAANARLRKLCYWLADGKAKGSDPATAVQQSQRITSYASTLRAAAEAESLLRNLTILERLGCLDAVNMEKLRRGKAPTITRGPYAGDMAEVDHIIPRAVAPELDEKLYNLEFMPRTMNRRKSAGIGQRQVALAHEWHAKGLLSAVSFQLVVASR